MEKSNGLKVIVGFLVIVFAVVFLSSLSNRLMGGKTEEMKKEQKPLSITESMTIEEFGKVNGLSKEVLKEVFGITVERGPSKDHWTDRNTERRSACKSYERRGFTRRV